MARLEISPMGFIMPICETCATRDCSNPVEKMEVSIMGVTKKVKMFNRGIEPRAVVQCEGYIK